MTYHFNEKRKRIIDKKALSELEDLKVKCSCGHTFLMTVQQDTALCNHCGKKVQNNTKEHFKYKLLKELRKNENKN